jgi:subtilase family serine protease
MVEGGQFVLQWSGYGNIPEKCVNIDLFEGISHVMAITGNVCVNGYNWQLPPGMSGTGYKIRVRTIDNAFTDDSDTFSILTTQPDLRITNLHTQPASPDMADDITVSAVIINTGNGTANPTNVVIRLQYQERSSERTLTTPSLGLGGHQPVSETFDAQVAWGDLTATVEVDTQGLVAEADEGNNTEQLVFSLVRLPNLISCVNDDYYTHIWSEVHIQFRVKNYSFEGAGPFVYRTYIEDKGQVSHNIPGLGPFETYDVRRSVTFGTAGGRNYWGKADFGETVREYREDDNQESGRIHSSGLTGSFPTQYPECD